MGESRQELLSWLNNLLQLNITKVEQCGTGAALCQIFDSIFLDVPMSKVKFNVNAEYAYISNFKVLQSIFTRHGIDRSIPVEALIKCKMQDNLEFLQWTKRYWDTYFPGHDYDAVGRRQASGAAFPTNASPPRVSSNGAARTSTASRRPVPVSNTAAARTAPRTASATSRTSTQAYSKPGAGAGNANAALLAQTNAELTEQIAGLERERDFYFRKLRDIEVLLQTEVETRPELENGQTTEAVMVQKVQSILYSTEEGFEIPEEGEEGMDGAHGGVGDGLAAAGDEETF